MCRKELITKLHNFVHLNLCIALASGLFLFLTGIQTATGNIVRLTSNEINCMQVYHHYCTHHPPLCICILQGACKFIAFLLHYFFLATFTWTLCEAVLIYNLLKAAFGANNRKWIYVYLIFGWGIQHTHASHYIQYSTNAKYKYKLISLAYNNDINNINVLSLSERCPHDAC